MNEMEMGGKNFYIIVGIVVAAWIFSSPLQI